MKSFFIVVKHTKDCSKVRNNGALGQFTFKELNKLALFSNFLAFIEKNFLLDACGSGSTALLYIFTRTKNFANIFAKTKNFSTPFLPVSMGPRWSFLIKKSVDNLVTLSLEVWGEKTKFYRTSKTLQKRLIIEKNIFNIFSPKSPPI